MKAKSISQEEGSWTLVIKPRGKFFNLNLKDLWRYRDLTSLFVRRDFVATYKQSILGPLWFLIQPTMNTLIYMVVFGNIAHLSSDGLPRLLFYFAGSMLWQYFATCLNKTSDTFVANAAVFGKVYFPRLTAPISIVISNLITLGIQFVLFLVFLGYYLSAGYPIHPNLWILVLPVLLVFMAALGLGFGIIISSLTTKYRDLRQLVTFGVQLWMYITPVVYPLSEVPQKWRWLVALNPMSSIIEGFRYAFTGVGTVEPWSVATSAGITLFVLFVGMLLFNRVERDFMDVI